jgi:hypothetical protein
MAGLRGGSGAGCYSGRLLAAYCDLISRSYSAPKTSAHSSRVLPAQRATALTSSCPKPGQCRSRCTSPGLLMPKLMCAWQLALGDSAKVAEAPKAISRVASEKAIVRRRTTRCIGGAPRCGRVGFASDSARLSGSVGDRDECRVSASPAKRTMRRPVERVKKPRACRWLRCRTLLRHVLSVRARRSCTVGRMRGLLVLLFALSACAVAPPAPTVTQEVILDITNNRDEPLIVRVVPRLLPITGPPASDDTGPASGSEVAAGERRGVRLAITADDWTITVNGSAMIRSDEQEFVPGGWTAGRMVVDPNEATMEMIPSEPMPSN